MTTRLGGIIGDVAGPIIPRGDYAMKSEEDYFRAHYPALAAGGVWGATGFRWHHDRRHYHFFANGFTQENNGAQGRVANDVLFDRLPCVSVKFPRPPGVPGTTATDNDWFYAATCSPTVNVTQYNLVKNYGVQMAAWQASRVGVGRWGAGIQWDPHHEPNNASEQGTFGGSDVATAAAWHAMAQRVCEIFRDDCGVRFAQMDQNGAFLPGGDGLIFMMNLTAGNQSGSSTQGEPRSTSYSRWWPTNGSWPWGDQHIMGVSTDAYNQTQPPNFAGTFHPFSWCYQPFHTYCDQRRAIQDAAGRPFLECVWETNSAEITQYGGGVSAEWTATGLPASKANWYLQLADYIKNSWPRLWMLTFFDSQGAPTQTDWKFDSSQAAVDALAVIMARTDVFQPYPTAVPPPPPPPPPPIGVHPFSGWKRELITGGQQAVITPPPPPPPPPPDTAALSEIPEASCDHYASFWAGTNAQTLQSGRSGGCFGEMVKCGAWYWVGGYMDTIIAKDRVTTYNRFGLYAIDQTTLDIDPSFNAQLLPTGYGGGRVWDLATDGTRVVAVGAFTSAKGSTRSRIAVFNSDGSLSTLFAGWTFNNIIHAVEIDGTDLYLAGDFTSVTPAGGNATPRTRLCKISTWTTAPVLDPTWQPTISSNSPTYQLHLLDDSGNKRMLITVQSALTISGVVAEGCAVGLNQGISPYWWWNTGFSISSVSVDDRTQQVAVGVRGEGGGPGNSGAVFSYGGGSGLITYDHFFHTDGDVQATGFYKLSSETDPMILMGGHGQFCAAAPDIAGTSLDCNGLFALNSADATLRDDFRPFLMRNVDGNTDLVNGGGVLKTWGYYSDEAVLDVDGNITSGGLFCALGDFTKVQTHDGSVVVKPKRRIAFFKEIIG
ncbi:MAG: delta-60 repeat domain-containing protein [Actinomycetota bacterium]